MSGTETLQAQGIEITVAGPGLSALRVEPDAAGRITLPVDGPPGLYQLSVVADARDYDWDLLYEPLHKYNNHGEVTGPWDFSINHNSVPVVPAYRVSLGGRYIGLWFFERVSLEDLERRRFRGRMAFYLREPATLELVPYRPMQVRWQSAVLEPDPEDTIEPLPEGIGDPVACSPAARWADPALWEELREALNGSHAIYREPLAQAVEWAMSGEVGLRALPVLLAAWRLADAPGALDKALAAVGRTLAMPAFSNPNPDGYSHNGDMGAMYEILGLAWAWHALGDELGDERRARVVGKLRTQGDIFFELSLLNRDYWGGSILQDHGWKSMFGFGAAALHLLGVVPEAERWVGYIVPRLRRSLAAMPRDGVIPGTSHYGLFTYTDEVTHYRDALLALAGEDIFDQPQFRPIVDFVAAAYDARTGLMLTSGRDAGPLYGGHLFLNRMAARHRDGTAAWLQRELLRAATGEFTHGNQPYCHHVGAVLGLLTYDPDVPPAAPGPMPARLRHFQDSALAHYRNDETGVVLAMSCGPFAGYNAERQITCSCDRLAGAPGAGHFTLCVDGVPLLCTPDGGYRLKSFLRSCLLVDDQGQYGDIGYPMSIPSWRHRGEQIESVRFDESTGEGSVRLNLQPAYAEETGVLLYRREFIVGPDRRIICRDRVVCDRPRTLSWLFQTKGDYGAELDGLAARIGDCPGLRIEPATVDLELRASIQPTQVVWSYSSANYFRPFVHVRYDTAEPVESAVVQFVLSW